MKSFHNTLIFSLFHKRADSKGSKGIFATQYKANTLIKSFATLIAGRSPF